MQRGVRKLIVTLMAIAALASCYVVGRTWQIYASKTDEVQEVMIRAAWGGAATVLILVAVAVFITFYLCGFRLHRLTTDHD